MVSRGLASVIIPTFYRNELLRNAIESAISQSYDPTEIIVVDDSGEGHARNVVQEYPTVTYVEKGRNEGPLAAWHTGFENCSGEYVQILDDDDEIHPTKIEKQVRILERQPETGVVHCGMSWDFGIDVNPKPAHRGNVLNEMLSLDTSPCVTSTLLVRSEVLNEVFPIKEYPGSIDTAYKIELARVTEFDYVDDCLITRGQPGESLSESQAPVNAQWEMIRDYDSLYEAAPPEVKKRAISTTYTRNGYAELTASVWSLAAVRSFFLAMKSAPNVDIKHILLFFASFGGRPGLNIVDRAGRILKS